MSDVRLVAAGLVLAVLLVLMTLSAALAAGCGLPVSELPWPRAAAIAVAGAVLPEECGMNRTGAVAMSWIIGLVATVLAGGGALAARQHLRSDRHRARALARRPGFADHHQVRRIFSARALRKRSAQLRPSLANAAATDLGWRIGSAGGTETFVSSEDSIVLIGPPRSGKGFRVLIGAILDWPGPLVTTSTRTDNLVATMKLRARRGHAVVFDPQRLSGIESTLKISPMVGCADPLTADQRAQAIVAGTALGAGRSNQEWAQAASGVLARLLHAAELSGADVGTLHRWGANPSSARDAVDILRSDGTPGWAADLKAVIDGDEKLRSSIWFGVAGAVRPLAIPSIRAAMGADSPASSLNLDEFLDEANTLYLLGTGAGAGSAGGYLGAVLDSVVEHARSRAGRSPSSRLDPPLGLVLDEIANMFSWPSLPRTMSDGGGIGISTLVVLQALSQASTAWSPAEAQTVWSSATAKIVLGGGADAESLRDLEALLGTRIEQYAAGGEQRERTVPLLSADEIRGLPQRSGLLLYRHHDSVLLDLPGWTNRRDAAEISSAKAQSEREQLESYRRRAEES